jgi:hypothetical protein
MRLGQADRTLIYAILFISDCLSKVGSMIRGDNYPSMSEGILCRLWFILFMLYHVYIPW